MSAYELRSVGRAGPLSATLLTIGLILSGPASGTEAVAASSGEWRLIGLNAEQQHFSPLKQINDKNVGKLGLAWVAEMPSKDGLVGVPLVADGVVYQSGPMGRAYANDVRTGRLLWSFDGRPTVPGALVEAWGNRTNRGLALWEDKVIIGTGDCRLIAIDRKHGTKVWEAQACDPAKNYTITGAPRVGGGKIFIGNANGETGSNRGHVDAFDAATGRHLWRFFTIPGDPAKGFENKAMEMASKTWGKDYWKTTGGGSPWEGITYDPSTNLVYIGTDGPSPFDPTLRGEGRGDELFTNAIVAVNADTGEYVWHYSTTPVDGWNYAATMPIVLADLQIGGALRHVVMSAPKNGFFYVLDARTGKLVNEPKPIIPINWASRVDMATGRPVLREEAKYWLKGPEGAIVSPSPMGAHNWMPMSFSPDTGLVYIPTSDYPTKIAVDNTNYVGHIDIDFYYARSHKLPFKGRLLAWDPVRQQSRWVRDIGPPYEGGTLATAGNLVFQGTTTGYFNAFSADTGRKLWSFFAEAGILGAPSTVQVDGHQIILVATGSGSTAATNFAKEFSGKIAGPARLLAFSFKGTAKLPKTPRVSEPFPRPPVSPPDAALANHGKAIWDANGCELCHGFQVIGGLGSVTDLRQLNSARLDMFSQFVRGGLLKDAGMPVFADSIREDELPALKAYIMSQAWKEYRASRHTHP